MKNKLKTAALILISVCLILVQYQNCGQANFEQVPTSENAATDDDLPVGTPISPLRESICGGGRTLGKHHVIGGNSCMMPVTSDETCDRWGCAIQINAQGDLACPEGTRRLVTDTTPVEYFICVKNIGSDVAAPELCGGTRIPGKYDNPSECNDPVTSDQSCNRWGCAIVYNSSGDSRCPDGTSSARISDDLTAVLCFR